MRNRATAKRKKLASSVVCAVDGVESLVTEAFCDIRFEASWEMPEMGLRGGAATRTALTGPTVPTECWRRDVLVRSVVYFCRDPV